MFLERPEEDTAFAEAPAEGAVFAEAPAEEDAFAARDFFGRTPALGALPFFREGAALAAPPRFDMFS